MLVARLPQASHPFADDRQGDLFREVEGDLRHVPTAAGLINAEGLRISDEAIQQASHRPLKLSYSVQ